MHSCPCSTCAHAEQSKAQESACCHLLSNTECLVFIYKSLAWPEACPTCQISEKILHANQEAAAEHLRVWRDAQLGTLWNFNKRLPLITTLLKEVMYNISEQHQAEQRAFSDTEAGSQQEKTANGDASAPSKATTDTAGAKARKAAVSVVMPVLSIFFPVPDLSVPVVRSHALRLHHAHAKEHWHVPCNPLPHCLQHLVIRVGLLSPEEAPRSCELYQCNVCLPWHATP